MKKEDIKALGSEKPLAPGGKRKTISLLQVKELSKALKVSGRVIEIQALSQGTVPERYERNIDSIGIEGQIRLLQSKVAIIGLGGLGGWIAEILARAGVGFIRLVDGDSFMESNLNRQLGSLPVSLGKNKALEIKKRLRRVNPSLQIEAVPAYLTKENLEATLSDLDLVIDALGDIPQRFILWEGCLKFRKPLVHGAIGGFMGQAALFEPIPGALEAIYGKPDRAPERGVEAELGTPSPTPAFIGALEAAIAIQILIGKGEEYKNKLFFFDLEHGLFNKMNL
jgi:molybdopterin/thiamine biosynthesis adenylyltransferase